MATAQIRKVIRIGGSLAIILPTQWAKGRIEPGQEMVVVGNGELRIFPVHSEDCNQDSKDEAKKCLDARQNSNLR